MRRQCGRDETNNLNSTFQFNTVSALRFKLSQNINKGSFLSMRFSLAQIPVIHLFLTQVLNSSQLCTRCHVGARGCKEQTTNSAFKDVMLGEGKGGRQIYKEAVTKYVSLEKLLGPN